MQISKDGGGRLDLNSCSAVDHSRARRMHCSIQVNRKPIQASQNGNFCYLFSVQIKLEDPLFTLPLIPS